MGPATDVIRALLKVVDEVERLAGPEVKVVRPKEIERGIGLLREIASDEGKKLRSELVRLERRCRKLAARGDRWRGKFRQLLSMLGRAYLPPKMQDHVERLVKMEARPENACADNRIQPLEEKIASQRKRIRELLSRHASSGRAAFDAMKAVKSAEDCLPSPIAEYLRETANANCEVLWPGGKDCRTFDDRSTWCHPCRVRALIEEVKREPDRR